MGAPRVRVADSHSEKLKETQLRMIAGRCDQRRQGKPQRGHGNELVGYDQVTLV